MKRRIRTELDLIQFLKYSFVGGAAAIGDCSILFILTQSGMYYLASAALGFIGGLVINYFLSKRFVFHGEQAKVSALFEFLAYGGIGIIGLIFTLILMYVITEYLKVFYILSKIITTGLVLIWNYCARKFLLYC